MRFPLLGIQALTALPIILTNILPSTATSEPEKKTTLYATHYNGHVYTLTLSHPSSADPDPGTGYTLSQTQSLKTCGELPSWLTLAPSHSTPEGNPIKGKEKRVVYCTDESGSPSQNGSLTALSVSSEDGRLTEVVKVDTPGGGVYSTVYESSGSEGEGDGGRWLAIAH